MEAPKGADCDDQGMDHRDNKSLHITEFKRCDDQPRKDYEEESDGWKDVALVKKPPKRHLH